jgi:hypothetical protein
MAGQRLVESPRRVWPAPYGVPRVRLGALRASQGPLRGSPSPRTGPGSVLGAVR